MNKSNHVLWTSALFPPTGGVGTLRMMSFIRHLSARGYSSTVLTRVSGADGGKGEDIPSCHAIRVNPWVRRTWLRLVGKFMRAPSGGSLFDIRWGNTFSGDWVSAAVRAVPKGTYRAIVSTAPPFSAHEVACQIHEKTNIPWIMDVRDPWFPEANAEADLFRRQCEERWFPRVTGVIATTPEILDVLKSHGLAERTPAFVVPNGYDAEECPRVETPWPTEKFTLLYAGNLYGQRRIEPLLEAMSDLIESGILPASEVELIVIGSYEPPRLPESLRPVVRFSGPVARRDLASYWSRAAIFCVIQPREFAPCVPTKLYEHLAMGRPVFAMVPPGSPSARLVDEFKAGRVAALEDGPGIRNALRETYRSWKSGTLRMPERSSNLKRYERGDLAAQFRQILERMT